MNHYNTLSLPPPPHPLSPTSLKQAYHTALLLHHPDKTQKPSKTAPSIDAIKVAYDVLSHPSTRAEYDRQLLFEKQIPSDQSQDRVLGNETVDLDDMIALEDGSSWRRPCRCGDPVGFVVHESDLEDAISRGTREVVVGCGGCSLSVRALFGVVEDGG
jgi:diphthamide biosynthesis protein 4